MHKMKRNASNINAYIYSGDFEVIFECRGSNGCKNARYYCVPASDDDECSCCVNGSCTNAVARMAALEELVAAVSEELERYKDELSAREST